jgi:hypothetical protein
MEASKQFIICCGVLFEINVLETIVLMLATVLMLMAMFAFVMMLMFRATITPEAIVPVMTKLFKQSQQLLLFTISEAFK